MKIRRVGQIKGQGGTVESHGESLFRAFPASGDSCSTGSYIIAVSWIHSMESNGELAADYRNLLALIPFMSRSKVNLRLAWTLSFEKKKKKKKKNRKKKSRANFENIQIALPDDYELLFVMDYWHPELKVQDIFFYQNI